MDWPWSFYAGLERIAAAQGIGPTELDGMHLWRIAARLGYDLVDGTTGQALSDAATIRSDHTRRAGELSMLPDDVKAIRARRAEARKHRRSDPDARKERRAAKVGEEAGGTVPRNDRLGENPNIEILT